MGWLGPDGAAAHDQPLTLVSRVLSSPGLSALPGVTPTVQLRRAAFVPRSKALNMNDYIQRCRPPVVISGCQKARTKEMNSLV
jgi:hypothetical protein